MKKYQTPLMDVLQFNFLEVLNVSGEDNVIVKDPFSSEI